MTDKMSNSVPILPKCPFRSLRFCLKGRSYPP